MHALDGNYQIPDKTYAGIEKWSAVFRKEASIQVKNNFTITTSTISYLGAAPNPYNTLL